MERRGQDPVIIAIPKHSMEVVVNPTATGFPLEELKEVVHIKTVKNATENGSLADSIAKSEDVGKETIPTNISILEHVDDNECSDEDLGQSNLKKLLEQ